MTQPRYIDAVELERLLPMGQAIAALEAALIEPLPHAPERTHLEVGSGQLLLMPAHDAGGAGVKLVTVAPDNRARGLPTVQGIYVLFDQPALAPSALFDAAALTALRTGAVSGVATKYLAASTAKHLVIFGAGVQARSHVESMLAVRDIEQVTIVSRSGAERLMQWVEGLGVSVKVGAASDVEDADLVCTCTTSREPVFAGEGLRGDVHVNAVGSYQPTSRELDNHAFAGARVVTDTPTALKESGDLIGPIADGVLDAGTIEHLPDAIRRKETPRANARKTIFKSVGAAYQDLIVARAAAARL